METFGMIFSCPGAFVVTLLYGLVLRAAARSWPDICAPLRAGSVVVLSMAAIELLLLWGLGITDARRLIYSRSAPPAASLREGANSFMLRHRSTFA